MMRLVSFVFMCGALAWPAAQAAGQAPKTMYRCGSLYQDRPCDSRAPSAPATKPVPRAAAQPAVSPAEDRRQIRCDNWGRQVLDLRQRERNESHVEVARGLAGQRAALESRMKADNCEKV
jgi:hypothetical protein